MAERPILFSGPMVRAILDGRKTQTRRICKQGELLIRDDLSLPTCPYGQPGDALWVRETWQYANWTEDGYPYIGYRADDDQLLRERGLHGWEERLEDTWAHLSRDENFKIDGRAADRRWRPAIHMPRFASRITLRVTSVRVERLQEIGSDDCRAEGMEIPRTDNFSDVNTGSKLAELYRRLWDSLNEKRGYGWDSNPLVWVVEFRKESSGQRGP